MGRLLIVLLTDMNPVSLHASRGGQTIMEMVVALGILTVGFLGIVNLLNSSLGLHRVIADDYKATYLAAEGVELIKNMVVTNAGNQAGSLPLTPVAWCSGLPAGSYEIDHTLEVPSSRPDDCNTSYPGLFAVTGRPLFFHPATHLYDYDTTDSQETPFRRTVTISYGKEAIPFATADDQMTVQSVVRWRDKTGDNEVNLIDYIFNSSST